MRKLSIFIFVAFSIFTCFNPAFAEDDVQQEQAQNNYTREDGSFEVAAAGVCESFQDPTSPLAVLSWRCTSQPGSKYTLTECQRKCR